MTMPDLQRYLKKLCLIKYELDINVFVSLNFLFLFVFLCRRYLRFYSLSEAMKIFTEINTPPVRKTTLSRFLSDKGFKGTIVNREWSLHEGSFNITLIYFFTLGVFKIIKNSFFKVTTVKPLITNNGLFKEGYLNLLKNRT